MKQFHEPTLSLRISMVRACILHECYSAQTVIADAAHMFSAIYLQLQNNIVQQI